jgi:gliding motility-associated-like protein
MFVVKVTAGGHCLGFDTVFVRVYQGPQYYTPTAFTPNGDGLNDFFRAIPVEVTEIEYFRIFNRYGQLLFQTNKWLKGWDGTYQGKKQPMGTYVWTAKYKFVEKCIDPINHQVCIDPVTNKEIITKTVKESKGTVLLLQ